VKLWLLAAASLMILSGCQQTSAPSASEPKPAVEGGTGVDGGTAVASATAEDWSDKVPADLMHDGYIYGGFSAKSASQKFVFTIEGQTPQEGEANNKFVELKDGKAIFERARSGALANVGSDTAEIRKEGVFVASISSGKVSGDTMELPAKLEIGKTWPANTTIDSGKPETGVIKQTGLYKVVRDEKVTVQGKSYDSRVVVMEGTMAGKDTKATVKTTFWLVKDLGAVKTRIERTMSMAKSPVITIELKP
jgi:hypothetical protein